MQTIQYLFHKYSEILEQLILYLELLIIVNLKSTMIGDEIQDVDMNLSPDVARTSFLIQVELILHLISEGIILPHQLKR